MADDNRLAYGGDQLTQLEAAVRAARASLERVVRRQYAQECALHDARASQVDTWVAAAYDRLHEAIGGVREATAGLVAAQAALHANTQVAVS
jgi:hypothetical protein